MKNSKLIFWLFSALLFTLPFGLRVVVNILLLMLFVGAFISFPKNIWQKAILQPVVLVSWMFYLGLVLSLVYTSNLEMGLRNLETKLSFLIMPPIITAYALQASKEQKLRHLKFFIGGNIMAFISLLLYAAYRTWLNDAFYYVQEGGSYQRYFFLYETFSEPFMHPGYLATYAGVALLATLYFVKSAPFRERLWAVFAVLILFVELLLLQARINLIALIIVFLLASIYYAFKLKAYKFILAPTAFFVLLAAAVVVFAPKSFKERYLDAPQLDYNISGSNFNSATYRLAEWKCALHVIKEKPLLGVGVGDTKQKLLDAYEHFKFWSGIKYQYNAHNQYLETTLALGIVGLFLLLALLIAYAAVAINHNNITIAAAVIFFALCMLTESMFERAWAVILFNLFFPYFTVLTDSDTGMATKKAQ